MNFESALCGAPTEAHWNILLVFLRVKVHLASINMYTAVATAVFLTGQGGLPDGLDGLRWSSPVHSFWWTAMTQFGIPSGLDGLVQISVDWVGLQSRLT
jgi:hypothetical protein